MQKEFKDNENVTAVDMATPESTAADVHNLANGAEIDPVAEWKDKALRAVAELENARKRHAKEIADTRQFAVTNFARELLNVNDNVERAQTACSAENALVETIKTGVDMLAKQFKNSFDKFEIKKIESVGQPLNPDLHQVLGEEASADVPAGHIVKEAQAGYTIAGRLLRPALVFVAKGE